MGGSRPLPPLRAGNGSVCVVFYGGLAERRAPELWERVRGEDRRRALGLGHYPALYYPVRMCSLIIECLLLRWGLDTTLRCTIRLFYSKRTHSIVREHIL